MRRWATVLLALGMGAVVPAATSIADAAPYPGNDAKVVLGGHFTPGGTGTFNIGGAPPNTLVTAIINSAPIAVSDTSDASGILNYAGFAVPSDFALNASHSIRFADGFQLAFCVGSTGDVVPCSQITPPTTVTPPGALPATGGSRLDDVTKIGAGAVAAGALMLLWRRRRLAHD